MTTERRPRRRHPAATARVVSAGVSATLAAGLVGAFAAGAAQRSAASGGTAPVAAARDRLASTAATPQVFLPSGPPVASSRGS